jgi:hypothetical protein
MSEPLTDDPSPEYRLQHVRNALATDPRVGELELDIELVGERCFVRGFVASEDRRHAIAEVIGELVPDVAVVDETTLMDFPAPDRSELLS